MKRLSVALAVVVLFGAGCSVYQASPSGYPAQTEPVNGVELNLSGQGLTSIPMDVFSRTNLERLDLSKNKLTDAPQSQIGQLTNLKYLDLSGNALTGLPAELGQLKNLETLNVSNNQLTGLPMELGNLTQLRVLDMTGNAYSARDLDEIASKLTKTEIRR